MMFMVYINVGNPVLTGKSILVDVYFIKAISRIFVFAKRFSQYAVVNRIRNFYWSIVLVYMLE